MKVFRLLGTGLIFLTFASCCQTPKDRDPFGVRQLVTATMEPIYRMGLFSSGAIDLFYCSASFRSKHGRFPEDFAELTEYVQQSNGYLVLGQYERVNLKLLPADELEIRYVRVGQTNEMKLTMGGPEENK